MHKLSDVLKHVRRHSKRQEDFQMFKGKKSLTQVFWQTGLYECPPPNCRNFYSTSCSDIL